MKSLRSSLVLAALLAAALLPQLRAQTVAGAPGTIDYQGKALDATGAPLANTTPANYEMLFRIYDSQEGGAIVWAERQIVTVSRGMFSVRLGEGTAISGEGQVAQTNLPEAFNGRERFLGVTIVISGQTPVEILPRLAFLATPFAYVANKSVSAERLLLNSSPSAPLSSLNVAQMSYATQTITANATLTDQNHTVIANAASTAITINLPGTTTRRQYYIAKFDTSTNIVTVVPPAGGQINGGANIKLKVRGESVVIQNIDNNNWWVISDTRDKTPVGTIVSSGQSSATPPPGYLYCNGQNFSRTGAQFVDLFAAIGTAWGAPNASEFRVPDLRGAFLRGVDGGRGWDDDRNGRTAVHTGANAGDAVGTYQGDSIRAHNHAGSVSGTTSNGGSHYHVLGGESSGGWNRGTAQTSDRGRNTTVNTDWAGEHSHSFSGSFTTSNTGSAETRPENMAVYYFIKY